MSGKRARAKRRRVVTASRARSAAPVVAEQPRRDAAVRRARWFKIATGTAAALTAIAAMALARLTFAGHAKHATPPLAIPQPLYNVVRRNLLQAGILAPATAPTSIVTGSS
jgi:hypothetical protein